MVPISFGILPSSTATNPITQRNLTLLAKVLQKLSNDEVFDASMEPYLAPLNVLMSTKQTQLQSFLYHLGEDPTVVAGSDGEFGENWVDGHLLHLMGWSTVHLGWFFH